MPRLEALAERTGRIGDVRGRGAMIAVEVVVPGTTEPDPRLDRRRREGLPRRGRGRADRRDLRQRAALPAPAGHARAPARRGPDGHRGGVRRARLSPPRPWAKACGSRAPTPGPRVRTSDPVARPITVGAWSHGQDPRVLTAGDVVGMLDGDAGAYVHVPFCSRICPFCPYNKVVPRPGQPARVLRRPARARSTPTSRRVPRAPRASPRCTSAAARRRCSPTSWRPPPRDPGRRGARRSRCCPPTRHRDGLDALRGHGLHRGEHRGAVLPRRGPAPPAPAARRPRQRGRPSSPRSAGSSWWTWTSSSTWSSTTACAGAFLRDLTDCFELGVDQVSTYPLMRFGYTPFGADAPRRRREHEVLAEATRIAADARVRAALGLDLQPAGVGHATPRSPAGASSAWAPGPRRSSGRDFLVNHFGVADLRRRAWTRGRLPGRALAAPRAARAAPPTTLLAGLRRTDLARGAGCRAARPDPRPRCSRWRPWSPRARCAGSARATAGFALTPRGFDRYHDLERPSPTG